jgi:NAD(P)-binding Rossmann-like domain
VLNGGGNRGVFHILLGFLQLRRSGDEASYQHFMLLDVARGPLKIWGRRFRASLTPAETFGCKAPYLRHQRGWGLGMRVAVIGTGIAGNAAAWTLSKRYPVTVYDRELRPGGHSHTVSIDYDGTQLAVDIGFIVYNELNYPDLTALFAHLGIETVESCMSFAVTADAGRFEWKGGGSNWRETATGLFAQPGNLLSPSYLRMLGDILTFNRQSIADYAAGRLAGLTLAAYFRYRNFAPRLPPPRFILAR